MKLKLYNVDFYPIWPVGGCLIILARDEKEAEKIASKTILHTPRFTVKEVDTNKPGVVVYLSGDY